MADPETDAGLAFEHHDHAHCADDTMARAEAVAAARGARLTPVRRRVLEILLEAHRAMGAYEVLDRLAAEGFGNQPPVAYRALEFLVEHGLAHRVRRLNAFAACMHPGQDHSPVFLICRSCDAVAEARQSRCARRLPGGWRRWLQCRACDGGGIGPVRGLPRGRGSRMTPLIEARGLTVRHGGVAVLANVDFVIRPGEIVTIVGPNGSGKSTLIRALIGLAPAAEGAVTRRAGLRIGYVPQRLQVDAGLPMTVRRFLSLPRRVADGDAAAALARVGVADLGARQMAGLSGGQFQRVLLARALLSRPDILMLDEPTQGLDQPGVAGFYRLIEEVRAETRAAVLMVSHDLHVVMSATDRVICLNGHVCCEGTPQVVTDAPEYRALFGLGTGGALALYRHVHDHDHDRDHGHGHDPAHPHHIHGPDCKHEGADAG
ncbi:zinc ABC transporter ATP-binding protein ZnuC [Frigidibacter mobilis]|uniref:Zinc ABC transporter ATP-binding protein ZnuC n=2 Tax=Frigidibacter mobilis TaxID=1335048 RepID=A0A159YZ57_9RHOB|nr:zinc ABC transporter ATP-binding protein ZnuC [Frigidibacter mobilis]